MKIFHLILYNVNTTLFTRMASDFIQSKRCGKLLVDDQNYLYIKVNVRSDRVNWKCLEFRRENCPARTRTGVKNTDELHIYSASPHNHTSTVYNHTSSYPTPAMEQV